MTTASISSLASDIHSLRESNAVAAGRAAADAAFAQEVAEVETAYAVSVWVNGGTGFADFTRIDADDDTDDVATVWTEDCGGARVLRCALGEGCKLGKAAFVEAMERRLARNRGEA